MSTIITKPILHINSEELPHMIRVDILGENYDEVEFDEIYEGITKQINDPIKIDDLQSILRTLKGKGCNYVAIKFHSDHQEYEFDGVHISLATQDEIIQHAKEQRDKDIELVKRSLLNIEEQKKRFETRLKQLTGEE